MADNKRIKRTKPITLHPLTPEAALKALLETKPEEKSKEPPQSNPSNE
jgi:hypothetical protein